MRVYWSQALMLSHAASAPGRMPGWVHWPEAPATFLIAALISWVSLLYGFHHEGRPFGSRKATEKTTTIIVGTALIAAVLSVFVPHLPLSIGIFIPALLCRSALKEGEGDQELRAAHPQLAAVITLGIGYMIGRLRETMVDDRATWCERLMDKLRSVDQSGVEDYLARTKNFATAAAKVRSKLIKRLPDDLKVQVTDHYAAINPAIAASKKAFDLGNSAQAAEEYNKAEEALYQLLQFAYDWRTEMGAALLK